MDTLRKFDSGTILTIAVTDGGDPVDVSDASQVALVFRRPDRTTFARTPTLGDTEVSYEIQADDLDMVGSWEVQLQITLPDPNGGAFSSGIGRFEVGPKLGA